MSNCTEPGEKVHYEPSHLDLCCLQKPIIIAYGSERVKEKRLVIILRSFFYMKTYDVGTH